MDKERLVNFCVSSTSSIVDAMAMIDTNAKGILFVVDENRKLVGSLTDGDIRRWILKAGSVGESVCRAMRKTPRYLYIEDADKAEQYMHHEVITALPLVDHQMLILDIVLLSEINNISNRTEKKKLTGIPVVVMAGGKGTRLYPYTKILPKPLIPIGDTPIVERVIDCFTEYGINDFYMTVNYKKGMIRSYFADLNPPYSINYVEETMPLGTGGSIKLIEEKFENPVFVTNCDSLIIADYADLYEHHLKSGNAITMVSALKNIQVPYGVLHTGDNGEIMHMEEKPKLSYFINTGMYVINPETIDLIPEGKMFHMTHLVEAVMDQGGKVGMYPIGEDSFLDMGEFGEMKRMEEKLNIVSR